MKRIIVATLPLATLLLASCSWMYPPQKSDLRLATQAATIAGMDDVAARKDPIELIPAKPASATQPALSTTGAKPVVILPPAAPPSFPASAPAPVLPKAVADASVDTAAMKPAMTSAAPKALAGEVAVAASGAVAATVKPLAAGPAAAPIGTAADIDTTVPVNGMIGTRVPVNGTAIHLASYREIGSAKRGWQILSKSYKELVPLKPLYVAVDLPGKGHVLRLYGTGTDAASLKTICTEMHAEGAYCAANIAF